MWLFNFPIICRRADLKITSSDGNYRVGNFEGLSMNGKIDLLFQQVEEVSCENRALRKELQEVKEELREVKTITKEVCRLRLLSSGEPCM